MELTKVLFSVENGVAIISMNSPHNLNAIDEVFDMELLECFAACEHDDSIRAVIFCGEGRAFSAGGDLNSIITALEAEPTREHDVRKYLAYPGKIAMQIRNIRKPVIAVMQGAVAGAAASLALVCDFRIAAEDMMLIQAFIKVGLVTDGGAVYLLNKLIGAAKTTEMVMTGRVVKAEEALELGLVNEVVSNDKLMERAMEFAQKFVRGPSYAYHQMKNLINRAAYDDLAAYLDYETELQRQCVVSQDAREAMHAFLEKRKPVFQGKP